MFWTQSKTKLVPINVPWIRKGGKRGGIRGNRWMVRNFGFGWKITCRKIPKGSQGIGISRLISLHFNFPKRKKTKIYFASHAKRIEDKVFFLFAAFLKYQFSCVFLFFVSKMKSNVHTPGIVMKSECSSILMSLWNRYWKEKELCWKEKKKLLQKKKSVVKYRLELISIFQISPTNGRYCVELLVYIANPGLDCGAQKRIFFFYFR